MTIDQKRICYISGNYGEFVHIYIVDVIDEADASTLGSVSRLDDPNIFLAVMLLQLLVMLVEFSKFIRKNVSVRNEIEMLLPEPFLHSDDIETESVFTRDLMTLREMINLLVLVEALVEIAFATRGAPKNVPFVRLGRGKSCRLEHRPDQFVIESQHLEEKLTVFNMVALLVTIELHRVRHHLLLRDVFEDQELRIVFVVVVVLPR